MKQKDTICTETMKLLGDYWVLRVISTLYESELRFCELQRALDMVNPVTLSNRLSTLESKHLVHRQVGSVDAVSVSYSLTHLGKEAHKVVKALDQFSQKIEQI